MAQIYLLCAALADESVIAKTLLNISYDWVHCHKNPKDRVNGDES